MNSKRPNRDLVGDSQFAEYLRQRLDSEAEALPPHIVDGLRDARRAAVARASDSRPRPVRNPSALNSQVNELWLRFWKPLASCATAAVLVLTVTYINTSGAPSAVPSNPDFEAEVLFSEEDLQLYEDLEFYSWLANSEL